MKDDLLALTKLSVFFQEATGGGLSSVQPIVTSTITTIQTLRNDLRLLWTFAGPKGPGRESTANCILLKS